MAYMGEGRCLQGFSRVTEVKRPLGRPRHRWEGNIKMDRTEIGIDGENGIQLAHNRVQWQAFVNTVMNLQVHKKGYFLRS
jgi:hypothetical protein